VCSNILDVHAVLFGQSFQAETFDLDVPYSDNLIPNLDSDHHDFQEDSDLEEDELDGWQGEPEQKGKGKDKLVVESHEEEETRTVAATSSAGSAPLDSGCVDQRIQKSTVVTLDDLQHWSKHRHHQNSRKV
jgi:hypothetical protein